MAMQPSSPEASAEDAGLRYLTDTAPGVRRRKAGKGFVYLDVDGSRIEERRRLEWIRALAIPPAWTDVWIAPTRNAHLQATGRDTRGRKVYRYHPRWREVRDAQKYERLIEFARVLPRIRRRTRRDLRRDGLPREKVLALVVRLLEETLIRVGNEEYARDNRSYGLSTMKDRHARVRGAEIRFTFRGKSGREHEIGLRDRRLARLVKRCQELPGQELFQYRAEDGTRVPVTSGDVNEYLRDISGHDVTAKDFRTWAGTVAAAMALSDFREIDDDAGRRTAVVRAIEQVAEQLGNTPAVCRACYVHPEVIERFLDGTMIDALSRRAVDVGRGAHALRAGEAAVLGLLQARLARERRERRRIAT